MPNWCYNELNVSGNTDSLEELQQLFENGFSLEKIVPTPPELTTNTNRRFKFLNSTQKAEIPSWHEWRLKNWGTKWDVMERNNNSDDKARFNTAEKDSIKVEFHTAWQPPMSALAALSEKFNDLKFKLFYLDEMLCFEGDAEIEDGNVSDDRHNFTQEEYDKMMEKASEGIRNQEKLNNESNSE